MSRDIGDPPNGESQELPDGSIYKLTSGPLKVTYLYKLNDLLNSICLSNSNSFQLLQYQSRKTILALEDIKK